MQTIVQTPTPNYKVSVDFYEKIGFKSFIKNDKTYMHSNGIIIEINKDKFSRAGLKCLRNNWDTFLSDKGLIEKATKTQNGYLITSPSGCCIYLEEVEIDIPENNIQPLIGNYGGFALETNQIEESVEFWIKFGYTKTMGDVNQGWVALSNNEGFTISLMKHLCCPHLFFNPSLSYFNGKENNAIIERIREVKVEITEEITHFNPDGIVDNIIIRDPGGLGFFIFND